MSKRLLLFAGALAVLLTWLAFRFGGVSTAPTSAPAPLRGVPVEREAASPPPSLSSSTEGLTQRESTQAPQPQSDAPSSRVQIHGRVHVVDAAGAEAPCHAGQLQWRVREPGAESKITPSTIADDSWTLECVSSDELEPVDLVCGAGDAMQFARVAATKLRASAANGMTIEAVRYAGVRLNVVDAKSRESLEHVQLVLERSTQEPHRVTDYPPLALVESAVVSNSPLELPAATAPWVGWVTAPGHVWSRFAFFGKSGELTLALPACASASVIVKHIPSDAPRPALHVYGVETSSAGPSIPTGPLVERLVSDDVRFTLDGLRPGRATFAIVPAPATPFDGPRLGQVEVDLIAGENARVEIDLAAPAMRNVLGSLRVSVLGDPLEPPRRYSAVVVIEPLDRASALGRNESVSQFAEVSAGVRQKVVGGLPPGEYLISLNPSAASQRVSLTGGACVDVELSLDELRSVTLKVVRGADRKQLGNAEVGYRAVASRVPNSWVDVRAGAEDKLYRFRCSRGAVQVYVDWDSHETVLRDIEPGDEPVELEIELKRFRPCVLQLRAVQAKTAVPLPTEFWTAVRLSPVPPNRGMSAAVQLTDPRHDQPGARFTLTAPGLYHVEFPILRGLRPWPATDVSVGESGETVQDFEVELR